MSSVVGLETIDWDSLATGYGNARGVPDAIRRLVSENPSEREAAYWQLDNVVVVQSDLYPAAPYVVPFLLQMLAKPKCHGVDLIYQLLYEIGAGTAPDSFTTKFRLPEWPPGDHSLEWTCRSVVKSGLSLYLMDIQRPDPVASLAAIRLVAMLGANDPEIRRKLDAAVDGQGEPGLRHRLRVELEDV